MSKKSKARPNVITPTFVASYPKIFKAEKNELSGKDEFSVVALFKKGEDLALLKKEAEAVLVEEFGADKTKWPKGLKSPFRDQSDREKDGVMPAGHEKGAIFITLKTGYKPQVVDANVQPILDESEIYAGCICRASVRASYFDKAGNKGVSFYLQNLQKVKDGEPIGGGKKAASAEFAPVEGANQSSGTTDGDMWT
jgi:hypothetical protein